MGDLIEFKNLKKQNVDITKINLLLSNLENNVTKFIAENRDIIDKNFFDLFYEFKNIRKKLNNVSWLSNKKVEGFINMYNELLKTEDDFNRYSLLLEYIYIFYITKGNILEENNEYVNALLDSFCEMDEIGIKSYPYLVSNPSNSKIKEIIYREQGEESKKIVIEDIIEQLSDGDNILDVIMTQNEEVNDNVNNLSILTIDNIHNYYLNQAMFFGTDILSDHVFDNIDSIVLIKGYNGIIKNKFIQLIANIRNLKRGILPELEMVSDLVDIFNYLNERIMKYDINSLEKILFFKNINRFDMDEVFKYIKLSNEPNDGGLKL